MSVYVEDAAGLKEAVRKYDKWLEEQARYFRERLNEGTKNQADYGYALGSYESYMCAIHMFTCVTEWAD